MYTPANPALFVYNHPVSGYGDTGKFNELMDTWKAAPSSWPCSSMPSRSPSRSSPALTLVRPGSARSDVTGCEPGFVAEFPDTPVASRSLSSSRLVMVVKRETWNPILLCAGVTNMPLHAGSLNVLVQDIEKYVSEREAQCPTTSYATSKLVHSLCSAAAANVWGPECEKALVEVFP
ncbi:hypothetical protein DPEC_G00071060 [Dallia pectoralis]|uniref:Uncharacterized protein n=1 Tax=Dallia pectoralis TaxID=75939 RepID=A0ACC2H282_DALPE|nr:hypothetical protein DPEC_G00071060 [Dallia pectoralis]